MRNSPPIPRTHGAVFRIAPTAIETNTQGGGGSSFTDEVLGSLVCVLSLRSRLRRYRIEQAHGRLRILPDPQPTPPTIEEVPEEVQPPPSAFLVTEVAIFLPSDASEPETVILIEEAPEEEEVEVSSSVYRIGPRELGQFVMRAIGFRYGLKKYLDEQARKKAERIIERETRAVDGRVVSRRSLDYQALTSICRNEARRDLEAKIDQLIRGGRWLENGTRRSDYTANFVVMPSPDPLVFPIKRRSFFFIVERNDARDGGRVVAVHEPDRFARLGRKKQPMRRTVSR